MFDRFKVEGDGARQPRHLLKNQVKSSLLGDEYKSFEDSCKQ
jgi:hypothetical protein